MRTKRSHALRALAVLAAAGMLATACASERDDSSAEEKNENQPLIFAAPGDARSLDPFYATDGETFRVTRQMYNTLLKHEAGGSEIVGDLAKEWSQNDEGTVWTFDLHDDVTFHDGEQLNAEAVCANYDHWFNLTGDFQDSNVSYYWQTIFGGFAENENDDIPPANYVSCTAEEDFKVVIEVENYSASLPGGFSMAAFGIMSPKVLEDQADMEVTGEPGAFEFPEYSQNPEAVAGTGPYRAVGWDKSSQEITLERFDEYWGEPAGIKTLIIKTISDENARKQALEAGDIHGYDLVAPADVGPLKDAGFEVPDRGVFNVLYMAYQQEGNEALEDLEVRQALAHAVDRQRIVDTILPEGSEVASQFMPPTLDGWSPDVTQYEYDPDKAMQLLDDAGYADLEIDFCYPTEVTRPYMPAPRDIFDIIKADLEAAGITVNEDSMPWGDYVAHTDAGGCSLYLLGWTGDFNEAHNFIGTWFGDYDRGWGFRNDEIFDAMDAVANEPDPDQRETMYIELNEMIMDFLPGLPISSSPPSIAFSADLNPPTTSPLTQEDFSEATWK